MDILEQWELTPEELTEIVDSNPSLRGIMLGYVAEYQLRKIWFSGGQFQNVRKFDNHDRSRKADWHFAYRGVEMSAEVKSLQSNSIRKTESGYTGTFQCDASDRRPVTLPNGDVIATTCLLAGQFDLLAVNLFAFEDRWRFAFARNSDLPRSRYWKYTPEQRQYLLASSVRITWPLQPPFEVEPFRLLDEIAAEKSRAS